NLIPKFFGFVFNLTPVTEDEMSLLKEISFLLKTFFFLYLGMIMQVSSLDIFLWASLITVLMYVTRYVVVRIVFSTKEYSFFDALISFGMGPRGLACAVLATLPLQKGYAEGEFIQNIIFYIIFISISTTSLFVIFGKRQIFRKLFRGLFNSYPEHIEMRD
ncbi:MAG: cation:proton antiporter, partial [Bdellovibrionales bacterium]